jgi:hypothetical protein
LRLAACSHRKFRRASCSPFTWRREASISRLPTFMLRPKTVTRLTGRLAPRTRHPPPTRLVMCHRGCTEHRHTMKDIDQCTRRPRPTLTTQSTPTLMPKNFRRAPLPLCHTTALRIVYSTQPMVGPETVTNATTEGGSVSRPLSRLRWSVFSSVCRPDACLHSNLKPENVDAALPELNVVGGRCSFAQ